MTTNELARQLGLPISHFDDIRTYIVLSESGNIKNKYVKSEDNLWHDVSELAKIEDQLSRLNSLLARKRRRGASVQ